MKRYFHCCSYVQQLLVEHSIFVLLDECIYGKIEHHVDIGDVPETNDTLLLMAQPMDTRDDNRHIDFDLLNRFRYDSLVLMMSQRSILIVHDIYHCLDLPAARFLPMNVATSDVHMASLIALIVS